MSDMTLVTDLSDTELDAVSGGFAQTITQSALNLNIAILNFGDTSQNANNTQQAVNSFGGWGSVKLWSSVRQYARA